MSNNAKILVQIAFVLAAVVGVGYGIQTYRIHLAYKKMNQQAVQADEQAAQLTQQAAKLESDAQLHHPELPAAIAIQRESVAKADELMKSAPDDKTRRLKAAAIFYGYYFINTRGRVDFCNEQSTSIQPFVTAFEQNNKMEHEAARSILKDSGIDEEQIYATIKPQMRSMVETDMNYIATTGKTNAKGACELIAAKADTLADTVRLSKMQPAVYQVLMSGR
jgi:hypothetical protein